jgi:hypothetical protein
MSGMCISEVNVVVLEHMCDVYVAGHIQGPNVAGANQVR